MTGDRKQAGKGGKKNEHENTSRTTNWVVSWRRIREFLDAHPEDPSAEDAFGNWYQRVRHVSLESLNTLKTTFPNADLVGRDVVFNIGGNKYRLIAEVKYGKRMIYIQAVMTHREYNSWEPRK